MRRRIVRWCLSAQICEIGVTLASEAVEDKSNEIPAVQELLKKMDIEGCLIVADTLNCQQKTAEAIVAGKADYLLDVKANQRNLEEEIAEYIKDDALRGSMDKKRTVEKNRERIEIRTAYTSDDAAWLCGREKWKNLCCIGAIRKEVEADGKRTEEWHYYISSRKLSAEELLSSCTDGVGGGVDALVVRCSFWRRLLPDCKQSSTAELKFTA